MWGKESSTQTTALPRTADQIFGDLKALLKEIEDSDIPAEQIYEGISKVGLNQPPHQWVPLMMHRRVAKGRA